MSIAARTAVAVGARCRLFLAIARVNTVQASMRFGLSRPLIEKSPDVCMPGSIHPVYFQAPMAVKAGPR